MKYIRLNNYRCFTSMELSFTDRINLLIGDNAAGKTTVLRALQAALSSFFTGYSDENTRFLGLDSSDFMQLPAAEVGMSNPNPVELEFEMLDRSAAMRLESEKARQATRTSTRDLFKIKQYAADLQQTLFDSEQEQVRALPLFAGFSTEDIHSRRQISTEKFKEYLHKPSFGYYECLNGEGFFPYWIKRLLVLQEDPQQRGKLEIEGVRQAVNKALGPQGCNIVTDIDIRHNQGKVYFLHPDNRETESAHLSDGYRRIINIVIDIAFRCMLINQGTFGLDACTQTDGTVIIDEIDLHLHPALQSTILRGLANAFPQLQFIVSTHAPMVMTGVDLNENNSICKLEYNNTDGYTARREQLYGLDASTIIESALHTPSRAKDVDMELSELFTLIDEGQFQEAKQKLNSMHNSFGDALPELAKAQTMLDFLNDQDEENQ